MALKPIGAQAPFNNGFYISDILLDVDLALECRPPPDQ